MKRLAEILKRISAIELEVRGGNVDDKLSKELDDLLAEKKQLEDKQSSFDKRFENGKNANINKTDEEDSFGRLERMKFRDKVSYIVGKSARGKKFNEAETRALGSALTTTATDFVTATAEVNGVNNAGVLISTNLILDLLREEGKLSPILADISVTSVPGLSEWPYRKSRDKAKSKAQGAEGKDNQMEWGKLTGTKGYLQTIIPVTDEVLALTDFDFGSYILNQILEDFNEDSVEELIYGTGSDNRIKGVTVGAIAAVAAGYAAGEALDSIIAGIKKLKGKYRRGAKIYVAQDVYDEIFFAVDQNGNFKYPVLNNSQGISSLGPIRVELDENLLDGDFLIGNINKFYKVNSLIPTRIETERKARFGITEWVASSYVAASPLVIAGETVFVKGSKAL